MHSWNRAAPSLSRRLTRAQSSLKAYAAPDSSEDNASGSKPLVNPQTITLPLPQDVQIRPDTLTKDDSFAMRLSQLRCTERTRGVVRSSEGKISHGKYVLESILNSLKPSTSPDESSSSSKAAPNARNLPLVAPAMPFSDLLPTQTTLEHSSFIPTSVLPYNPPHSKKKAPKLPVVPAAKKNKKKGQDKDKDKRENKEKNKIFAFRRAPPLTDPPRKSWDVWDATASSMLSVPSEKSPSSSSTVDDVWSLGWGEDKLRPPVKDSKSSEDSASVKERKRNPPHMAAEFSKRTEGLLEPLKDGSVLEDLPPLSSHKPIATLAHGLDRVLFNPGVHWVQDPRSRVYNFHPDLQTIPKVTEFAFERLAGFIKSSWDSDLRELAHRENRTFAGSTSSLSGMLSQIYFLISEDKEVNTSRLSQIYRSEPKTFTTGQRMPASVLLNYKDGVYAIDSDKGQNDVADKNILTWMGTLLEKYLTMTQEEFATYLRKNLEQTEEIAETEEEPQREAYRYAKSERFIMRSQLDCKDPRLPGTGVFDIKTRACVPIRLDILNFKENSGYLIRSQHGIIESFEKEYYDLIRSAFLKYSFQVRIGNMDGVIVAYHNTDRIFGFQYLPIEEMDWCLFGPGEGVGDRVFEKCIGVMEKVADEIVQCFPEQSVRCTFETLENSKRMHVWVEPAEWEGDELERPIKQLEVMVDSFIGIAPAKGSRAVSAVGEPWTLHYVISLLSVPEIDMRKSLQAARERQFRAFNLPSGVEMEEIETFWTKLNFGGQEVEDPAEFKLENFQTAHGTVETLRELARRGREETMMWRELERGKPRIMLGGHKVPWVENAEEDVVLLDVKPDVASAEGEGHHGSSSALEAFAPETPTVSHAAEAREHLEKSAEDAEAVESWGAGEASAAVEVEAVNNVDQDESESISVDTEAESVEGRVSGEKVDSR